MGEWIWLGVLGAAGGVLWKLWGWASARIREALTVSIRVDDPAAYLWVAEWLAAQVRERNSRNLLVREDDADEQGEPLKSRAVFLPGEGDHIFWRSGRRIHVSHNLGGWSDANTPRAARSGAIGGRTSWRPASFQLTTLGRDTEPLKSLVLEAEADYRERRHDALPVWVARWGSWSKLTLRDGRPLESVVLEDGVAESLLVDVRRFLASRDMYREAGVPWRRGYLLHGPPGCGKSSLAKAVATECALPLYVVSLTRTDDDSFLSMLMDVRPRSVVLIEDIDEAVAESKEDRVTRSGLLNAIDGVAATEGRVLFLTTNHRERLDPALVRSGRADVHLELAHATENQANRLFRRFFPSSNGEATRFARIAAGATPASIQGHLIEHWAAGADAAVRGWKGS